MVDSDLYTQVLTAKRFRFAPNSPLSSRRYSLIWPATSFLYFIFIIHAPHSGVNDEQVIFHEMFSYILQIFTEKQTQKIALRLIPPDHNYRISDACILTKAQSYLLPFPVSQWLELILLLQLSYPLQRGLIRTGISPALPGRFFSSCILQTIQTSFNFFFFVNTMNN